MRYEIRDVQPIGDDEEGLLLEVAHWHGNAPIGVREPDFVEHVRIFGLDGNKPTLQKNSLGQPIRVDGVLDFPWREIDGQWIRWEPEPGDPDYRWDWPSEDGLEEAIVQLVERRSEEVKTKNLRGRDTFGPDSFPSELTSKKPGHVGRRPDMKAMRGKRGQKD